MNQPINSQTPKNYSPEKATNKARRSILFSRPINRGIKPHQANHPRLKLEKERANSTADKIGRNTGIILHNTSYISSLNRRGKVHYGPPSADVIAPDLLCV